MNDVWIHMAATSLTMQRLVLDPGTNLLTFLCSSIFEVLIVPDPAISCGESKHNKEYLSAKITNPSVRGNDAHDHAPFHQNVGDAARQDHMSPSHSETFSDCE